MNMTIKVKQRQVYGRTNLVITSDHAKYINKLTGKESLNSNDVKALNGLGFNFLVEQVKIDEVF